MKAGAKARFEAPFERDFIKKTADEFQDFFSEIMEKHYPGDFIRVRPWGKMGDRKNDGYLKSRRTLFQVYAPNEMSAEACIKKINEDFAGALPYWKEYFETWVFVHNSLKEKGLGPDVTKALLQLEKNHPEIKTCAWGFAELRKEAFELSDADLAALLGLSPDEAACEDWRVWVDEYMKAVQALRRGIFSRRLLRDPEGTEAEIRTLPLLSSRTQNGQQETSSITEIAAGQEPALILGGYGSAKSFGLRLLFLRCADQYSRASNSKVPIYLDLSAFPSDDVERMAATEITRILRLPPPQDPKVFLAGYPILLLVDGIEELNFAVQTKVASQLSALAHDYPLLRLMVAARTAWPNRASLGNYLKPWTLLPLADKQREETFSQLCKNHDWWRLPHRIRELCSTPIHLQMVVQELERGEMVPSDTPSKLFERFLVDRFATLEKNSTASAKPPAFIYRKAAMVLAQRCIHIGQRGLSYDDALGVLEAEQAVRSLNAPQVLADLGHGDVLLIDRQSGLVGFGHMSFRDYLGALCLLEALRAGETVQGLLNQNAEWFDAIVYAAGLIDDFDQQVVLLEQLLQNNLLLFFRALENRNVRISDSVEGVACRYAERLLGYLAGTYGRLVSMLDFPPRRFCDPFRFSPASGEVGINALVPEGGEQITYRYLVRQCGQRAVNIARGTADGMTIVGPKGERSQIMAFRLASDREIRRFIDFRESRTGLFHVYEIARDDFAGEVFELIEKAPSLFATPDMAYERLWRELWESRGLPDVIRDKSLANCLLAVRGYEAASGGTNVTLGDYPMLTSRELTYLLQVAQRKYVEFTGPLLPGQDIPFKNRKGRTFDAGYSPERAVEAVKKAITLILANYRIVVDMYFPRMAAFLPLRAAMPVKVVGAISLVAEKNSAFGRYSWMHYTVPIPGNQDQVQVMFGPREVIRSAGTWEERGSLLRTLGRNPRIALSAVSSLRESGLPLGRSGSLVTESVLELLRQDLAVLLGGRKQGVVKANALL